MGNNYLTLQTNWRSIVSVDGEEEEKILAQEGKPTGILLKLINTGFPRHGFEAKQYVSKTF